PDAASRGLIELADDQAELLGGQAARFGRAELTRAADIVSQGLTDMRGATAPRLLLEMMCARILLPGMDATAEGFGARLDRLERRLSVVGEATVSNAAVATSPCTTEGRSEASAATRTVTESIAPPGADTGSERPLDDSLPRGLQSPAPAAASVPAADEGSPAATAEPPPAASSTPETLLPETLPPPPAASRPAQGESASVAPVEGAASPRLSLVDVRQLWPGVLDRVKKMKRMTWILLSGNAQVRDVSGGILTIAFSEGARKNFLQSGHDEILRQALIDELGVAWTIEAIIDEAVPSGRARQTSDDPPSVEQRPGPPSAATAGAAARAAEVEAAKEAIRPTRSSTEPAQRAAEERAVDVHDDDDVIDDASLSSQELLARELGAEVIDDIRHNGN
ncbi:MAG: DNA polymerase III subunit gamma/tau, partial [Nocardioidaceae bacterium]